MSIARLKPLDLPKNESSSHDQIISALKQAIADQELDHQSGRGNAKGVAILFLREHTDNTFSESWLIQGLNSMEVLGLLKITGDDISRFGIDGMPLQDWGDEDDGEAPA